jgi:hypothetical protein
MPEGVESFWKIEAPISRGADFLTQAVMGLRPRVPRTAANGFTAKNGMVYRDLNVSGGIKVPTGVVAAFVNVRQVGTGYQPGVLPGTTRYGFESTGYAILVDSEIRGNNGIGFYGHGELHRCLIEENNDGVRARAGFGLKLYETVIRYCLRAAPNSHIDCAQYVGGGIQLLAGYRNLLDAFNPNKNDYGNGAIQHGSYTVGGVETGGPAPGSEWIGNHFDGGNNTLSGGSYGKGVPVLYRDNTFGTKNKFGTLTGALRTNMDIDSSNVYLSSGLPI